MERITSSNKKAHQIQHDTLTPSTLPGTPKLEQLKHLPFSDLDTTPDISSNLKKSGKVRFNWRMARAFIQLRTQRDDTFSLNSIPFSSWPKVKIPTLGGGNDGGRLQEMYSVTLPGKSPGTKDLKLFVKIVPIHMWKHQWDEENKWNGEFATDGENFVMEAAALAFLHEYAPGIAPKLMGIVEMCGDRSSTKRRSDSSVTHMVIISELYGEDLLDYLDRRDRKGKPLDDNEKHALQVGVILLMKQLHHMGIAHLDYTPENILIGKHGLRLCDFAKATPLYTERLRHVSSDSTSSSPILYPFESCEPTVGKGAYMPPECWKIYWKLEQQKILRPLDDLAGLRLPSERVSYYFKVSGGDCFMLGVVLFWVWSNGGVWKCSDHKQDVKFYHLIKGDMNFDLFRECREWPEALKGCLARILHADPWRRCSLDELLEDPWVLDEVDNKYLSFYTPEHGNILQELRKKMKQKK